MEKIEILSQIAARLDALTASRLVDIVISMRRQGFDEDAVATFLNEARTYNRRIVREAMRRFEQVLDNEGIAAVKSLTFTGEPFAWPEGVLLLPRPSDQVH